MSRDKRWERLEAAARLDGAHGWIQWKGTNVCMDVHCSCGARGHIDAEFAYRYHCGACGRLFDIGGYVRLVEVPKDEIEEGELSHTCTIRDTTGRFE